jgi:hypothetical protein
MEVCGNTLLGSNFFKNLQILTFTSHLLSLLNFVVPNKYLSQHTLKIIYTDPQGNLIFYQKAAYYSGKRKFLVTSNILNYQGLRM